MTDYDNKNTFVLFTNDKGDNPKRPDRTGTLHLACPHCGAESEHYLDGWIKDGKKGKFLSGKVKAKNQRQEQRGGGPAPSSQPAGDDFADDSIPF